MTLKVGVISTKPTLFFIPGWPPIVRARPPPPPPPLSVREGNLGHTGIRLGHRGRRAQVLELHRRDFQ